MPTPVNEFLIEAVVEDLEAKTSAKGRDYHWVDISWKQGAARTRLYWGKDLDFGVGDTVRIKGFLDTNVSDRGMHFLNLRANSIEAIAYARPVPRPIADAPEPVECEMVGDDDDLPF